jgi:hypothetical protein
VDEQSGKTRREDSQRQIRSKLLFRRSLLHSGARWFESRPGSGSHRIYYKQGVVEIVNIQPRSGKGKPYQVKQVRELLLKYKIALE